MAERLGVLVVAYGSREAAIIDALSRSSEYDVSFYVADKQANPYNVDMAERSGGEHRVIGGLDVGGIFQFAKEHESDIDFGIVGPEAPIIAGVRDVVESGTRIKLICPTRQYAIEGSKAKQRALIARSAPEANPEFRVFSLPYQLDKEVEGDGIHQYRTMGDAVADFRRWYGKLGGECAIKPDTATAGKGVVVSGDHFTSLSEAEGHFTGILEKCAAVVEQKLFGEESSLQCFSDGRVLMPLHHVRDYKRAFAGDTGQNTGGMGSYMDNNPCLPFLTDDGCQAAYGIARKFFEALKGPADYNPGVLGMPLYLAFIHTRDGPKILECNSRPGDPESINVLPPLKNDFAVFCESILLGDIQEPILRPQASVVMYKVPMTYGSSSAASVSDSRVDLGPAMLLQARYGDDRMRVYPGSMEIRQTGGIRETHMLSSRTVAVVGMGDTIEQARQISLDGIGAVRGRLRFRNDVASPGHIAASVENMKRLRA